MKFKTKIVSLLIVAVIGMAAVFSIAAASTETSTDDAHCGRFQLLVANNYLFKIDTTTGQVWRTWAESPSKDFMAPNIGRTNTAATTNAAAPNLEKAVQK